MDLKTLRSLQKRAALCRCNSCLLQKAKEMQQRRGLRDQSLDAVVAILEGLMRSGCGTAQAAFPPFQSPSWDLSGRRSGISTPVMPTLNDLSNFASDCDCCDVCGNCQDLCGCEQED